MSGFAWHETAGASLRHAELGAGPTLVVIDGAGGLRPSPAHERLAESRRVIVFPLPHAGSAAGLADALAQAIAGLGVGEYDVMAHGAGAAVALRLALAHPVCALALVAPLALAALPEAGAGTARLHAHPERHESLQRPHEAAERARLLVGDPAELAARLKTLETPVLALFGTEDKLAPPPQGGLYRKGLKDCNLIFVYDAAHLVDLDRPEAVAFIAGEFFGRHDQFLVSRESGAAFP